MSTLLDKYHNLPGGPQDIFYTQPAEDKKPTFVKGEGIYLWDENGKRYIDASSGPVTCNLGHANKAVLNAMHEQGQKLSFAFPSSGRNQPNIEFAKELTAICGKGFERALFGSGGSEAIDMAIKFCRQLRYAQGETQRTRLISCQPSYHGMHLGNLAVSGDPVYGEVFADMVTMGEKITAVLDYQANHQNGQRLMSEEDYAVQCAKALEDKIIEMGPDTVLAFIVEPVGGSSSGAIAPPEVYFNEVRRICSQYGVLLIYDEVMSGSGRTGEFLTSHYWPDARPDISIVAKGLGAGYIPLGAMLTSAELVDTLGKLTGFNYAYTYNASPVACATGLAVLNEIKTHDLLANCCARGKQIVTGLLKLQEKHPNLGDIRGRGLLIGIELVANQKTHQLLPNEPNAVELFKALAMDNGLYIYGRRSNEGRYSDNLLVAPPLNCTETEVSEILELIDLTFTEFAKKL